MYEEGLPNTLHLEHFGMGDSWYETTWAGETPRREKVALGGVAAPGFIAIATLEDALGLSQEKGATSLAQLRLFLLAQERFSFRT